MFLEAQSNKYLEFIIVDAHLSPNALFPQKLHLRFRREKMVYGI